MPWVYTLELVDYRDASVIQTDWEEAIPGNASVINDHGGVTVSGQRAVIVSQRNNPGFEKMTELPYVASISEEKEIPSRGSPDFNLPIRLGYGIELVE